MDAVIDETLRMYPPAQRVERECTNDIEYGHLKLKKGQTVIVPVYALHHDPDLYPEPDRFQPERFLKDSAAYKSRDPMAFLPFGAGPRACLGMRFALIEIKILLASVLSKFRFVPAPDTPVSLSISCLKFLKLFQLIVNRLFKLKKKGNYKTRQFGFLALFESNLC